MENNNFNKAEHVVQTSGCGLFQIIFVSIVYILLKQPTAFAMMFMSFGNYNPGWRCENSSSSSTDNNSISLLIGNNTTRLPVQSNPEISNKSILYYPSGSCDVFDRCQNIEFDAKVSTIVTEWELTCNRYWISSLIISVQMAGVLVGSLLSGHLGDLFGRKRMLYPFLALCGLLSVCSIFSPNWQTFTVIRFFIGITIAALINLYTTHTSEFLNPLWRSRVLPIPSWPIGGMFFGIAAMLCEDWKTLHIITAVICFLCCFTAIWVPESLRWLEVKNKDNEFEKVKQKILSLNKLNNVSTIDSQVIHNLESHDKESMKDKDILINKKYTAFDLFQEGYRGYSLIFGFLWIAFSMIYYAIIFGAKNLPGSIYINIIIVNSTNMPMSIFPIFSTNILGRKKTSVVLLLFTTTCLLVASGLELLASNESRKVGTLILAVTAQATIKATWDVSKVMMAEIYPTVVRAVALGYGNLMARVGGVLAPVLIPASSETLYVCYLVMSVLGVTCSVLMFRLPETKGKRMKQTFEDVCDS